METESARDRGVRVVLLVEDGLLPRDEGEVVPAVPVCVAVSQPVLQDVVVPEVLIIGVLLPHHEVVRERDRGRVSQAKVIIHNWIIIYTPAVSNKMHHCNCLSVSPPAREVDQSTLGEVGSVGRLHKVGPGLLRRPGVGVSVDSAGVTRESFDI